MKQLRGTTVASGSGASSTELAPADVPTIPPEIIGVHRVAVTMKVMQKLADIEVEAAGKTNGFKDTLLLDREPMKLLDATMLACDNK